MAYRATMHLDYTGQVSNAYEELKNALVQLGWLFVETSAFSIETDDVALVWRGIDLVARQNAQICGNTGHISALNFNMQYAANFAASLTIASAPNHGNALQNVRARAFP